MPKVTWLKPPADDTDEYDLVGRFRRKAVHVTRSIDGHWTVRFNNIKLRDGFGNREEARRWANSDEFLETIESKLRKQRAQEADLWAFKLRSFRERHGGLTQEDAARITGTPLRTWQGWEAEFREPPPCLWRLLGYIDAFGYATDHGRYWVNKDGKKSVLGLPAISKG